MIERPSDDELARARAVAAVQGTQALVYCTEHGGEIGQIRTTPEGRLFWANVPVEKGSGVAAWRKRLKEETGRRPSPAVYQVRVLIEMMAEAPDQPMAWCRVSTGSSSTTQISSHTPVRRTAVIGFA